MKVRCDRAALYEAAQLAGAAVAGRTPKPALQCLKLSAAGKHLTLSATDLELSVRYKVAEVEVKEGGDLVIPADRFNAILRESTDDQVDIETEGEATRIVCKDSKFKVFGFDAREFPPLPDFPDKPGFTLKAGPLRQMITRTTFAAAKEITRYAINGVLWEPKGGSLKLVGTDGKRLAQTRGKLNGPAAEEKSAVCPLKAMLLLERLLTDPDADVDVKLTDNEFKLRCGPAVVGSRLVEGDYPKYDEVIPKDSDRSAEFDAAALLSAVRRAGLLVSIESKRVIVELKGGAATLRSSAPEHGEAEITVPCEYKGAALEIAFNPDYLQEGLRVLSRPKAKFEFKGPDKPGVLKDEAEFTYVVMPLQIRRGEE
jgi:DNA polymerase-3 subunit beta